MTFADTTLDDVRGLLPPRCAESHKGDYGRVLIVGGSRGMAGAAALAGMAALRAGAGLVKIATADRCLETVAGFDPCYMTVGLPCDDAGRIALSSQSQLADLAAEADCIACGPGLGRSDELNEIVGKLFREAATPMVVDADGLNGLAAERSAIRSAGGSRVLTPHPGEFRRLMAAVSLVGETVPPDANNRADLARDLAAETGAVVVLKGHRTLVVDRSAGFRNTTGNPGMATGGSGDVLTGVIAALIGQRLSPLDAARLGVFWHGLAGDLASRDRGQVSLTAKDLIDYLPVAMRAIDGRNT